MKELRSHSNKANMLNIGFTRSVRTTTWYPRFVFTFKLSKYFRTLDSSGKRYQILSPKNGSD